MRCPCRGELAGQVLAAAEARSSELHIALHVITNVASLHECFVALEW